MSKAITEKHEERGPGSSWGPNVETAPSVLREAEPTLARWFGLIGLCVALIAGVFIILNLTRDVKPLLGLGKAALLTTIGVMAMLAHAAYDRDLQVRRLYWSFGLFLLAGGIIVCLIPVSYVGALFGAGYPAIGAALFFLLATMRNETDLGIRKLTVRLLGLVGFIGLTLAVILGNNFWYPKDFFLPYGMLIALMSIAYIAAFVTTEGISSDIGYQGAILLGVLGFVAFAIGFLRWSLPAIFHWFDLTNGTPKQYLVPYGLVYMALGLLAMMTSLGLWSDNRFVVLTKRELSALFYSPVIYILIVGLAFIGWILFLSFVAEIIKPDPRQGPLIEPIVARYLLNLLTVSVVILVVPVITMRLLSEEKRSGTMEVLMTAPVSETAVVFSKYFAALVVFFMVWIPWGLFLVGLRVGGGVPFDYFALLAFFVAVLVSGASFIAMGLFFSSLTQNQIIAAVATFCGMMSQLMLFFAQRHVEGNKALQIIIEHVSYPQLWVNSFQGILMPSQILFQLSFAVLWLFMTLKVLEARRWS